MKSRHILFSVMLLFASLAQGILAKAQTQQEKPPAVRTQEEKAPPAPDERDRVSKVFEIKYADVNNLAEILSVFGVGLKPNRDLKVIAVSGRRELVAAAEEAIKRLDVPPPAVKNIELTVYLLVASEQAVSPNGTPSELQGVINQLKGVVAYQHFRLLETLVIRSRDGESGHVSGVVPTSSTEVPPTFYNLSYKASLTSDDKERVIRIDKMNLAVRMPVATGPASEKEPQYQYQDTGVSTNIDVREGQKVVVGKPTSMSTTGGSKSALIVVVMAKAVD
ncbi:MAG: hypothetical protein HY314_14900 [Acidobacteria bacterium]|nr:hypothetical protein [Acidobacteriota bacterium]